MTINNYEQKSFYEAVKNHNRYTIGIYDKSFDAYIVNDGICTYYWWNTEEKE
jgi:hypothetical protein